MTERQPTDISQAITEQDIMLSPVSATSIPEAEASLSDALGQLDRGLPTTVDYLRRGRVYQRDKLTVPDTVRQNITNAFDNYPDEYQELTATTGQLFDKLHIDDESEQFRHAHIDRLLAGYPQNILNGLADHASAANLLAVIRTGVKLIEIADLHTHEYHPHASQERGAIAKLLQVRLPEFIASYGEGGAKQLETIATQDRTGMNVGYYINFMLKYRGGLPTATFDSEAILGHAVPESPFKEETAENAWNHDGYMGRMERSPTWGDLGQMIAVTNQWDREYGLSIRTDDDMKTSIEFRRGDGSIFNKNKLPPGGKRIFFHSHPDEGTGNGLYAPIISAGDIRNTDQLDHGGGYLNVICSSGVTLQVNSESADDSEQSGWVVESGALQGSVLSSEGEPAEGSREIMEQLHASKEPFTYSINTRGITSGKPRKVTFVHVPWNHLNTSEATLEDICFGDGLQKILIAVEGQANNTSPNLFSALSMVKHQSGLAA